MRSRLFARPLATLAWLAVGALALAVVTLRTRYQFVLVIGPSMEPSLFHGDLLVLDRKAYRQSPPARYDLVIVQRDGEPMVKRIVGLPGETVEVQSSRLYIDDQPVDPPHAILPGYLDIHRGWLGADRYAVLGDNRSLSPDEIVHAVVGSETVTGRIVARVGWRSAEILTYPVRRTSAPESPESGPRGDARAPMPGDAPAARGIGFPGHGVTGEVP